MTFVYTRKTRTYTRTNEPRNNRHLQILLKFDKIEITTGLHIQGRLGKLGYVRVRELVLISIWCYIFTFGSLGVLHVRLILICRSFICKLKVYPKLVNYWNYLLHSLIRIRFAKKYVSVKHITFSLISLWRWRSNPKAFYELLHSCESKYPELLYGNWLYDDLFTANKQID